MISENIEGIVLKTTPYKDNGLLLFVLTSDGINSLILRGAQKLDAKNHGLSQIGSLIRFKQTTDKAINTLTTGEILKSFSFEDDLMKIHQLMIVAELIKTLSPSISDYQTLFTFMVKWMDLLEKTNYPDIYRLLFEIKMLYLLGIGPDFKHCAICQKSHEHYYFSLNEGKIIGINCYQPELNDVILGENQAIIFKILYLVSIDKVDEALCEKAKMFYLDLNQFIDAYYATYYNYHSISKEIINQIH